MRRRLAAALKTRRTVWERLPGSRWTSPAAKVGSVIQASTFTRAVTFDRTNSARTFAKQLGSDAVGNTSRLVGDSHHVRLYKPAPGFPYRRDAFRRASLPNRLAIVHAEFVRSDVALIICEMELKCDHSVLEV